MPQSTDSSGSFYHYLAGSCTAAIGAHLAMEQQGTDTTYYDLLLATKLVSGTVPRGTPGLGGEPAARGKRLFFF